MLPYRVADCIPRELTNSLTDRVTCCRVAMLGVVGVLTVEAQGKGPWWEIPGKVRVD